MTTTTALYRDRQLRVSLVRAEVLEGRNEHGDACVGAGESGPFWVSWAALRRGRLRFWVIRQAQPRVYHVTRGRIGDRDAVVEARTPAGGLFMVRIWKTDGDVRDYHGPIPYIPTEVTKCR